MKLEQNIIARNESLNEDRKLDSFNPLEWLYMYRNIEREKIMTRQPGKTNGKAEKIYRCSIECNY